MTPEGNILKFPSREPRPELEKKEPFNDTNLRKFLDSIKLTFFKELPPPSFTDRIRAKEADAGEIANITRDIKLSSQFLDTVRVLMSSRDLEIALARGECSIEFQNSLDARFSGVELGTPTFLQRMNRVKPFLHLQGVSRYVDELKATQLMLQQAAERLESKLQPK